MSTRGVKIAREMYAGLEEARITNMLIITRAPRATGDVGEALSLLKRIAMGLSLPAQPFATWDLRPGDKTRRM